MNEKLKIDDSTIEVLKLEYVQTCFDWRNRDSMIWQALALLVAISGAAFSFSFNENLNYFAKLLALVFTLLLSILAMVKIIKDHHYQVGSQKYLNRLSEILCGKNHNDLLKEVYNTCTECQTNNDCKVINPRHHNCDYESRSVEIFGIKLTGIIYKKITKRSAFEAFYACNLSIIILTLLMIFLVTVLEIIKC